MLKVVLVGMKKTRMLIETWTLKASLLSLQRGIRTLLGGGLEATHVTTAIFSLYPEV